MKGSLILSKIWICVYFDQIISLLGVHPTEIFIHVHKDICIKVFITALFTIVKKKDTDFHQDGCSFKGKIEMYRYER